MNVAAYCTLPAARSVQRATGVTPLVSPPLTAETFDAKASAALAEADLIYFRLHGTDQAPGVWFGEDKDGRLTQAFALWNLDGLKLRKGCVVVIANCYGNKSALVAGFYEAGAAAVIAGPGKNFAAGRRVIGTDKLVKAIIKALPYAKDAAAALALAKAQLLLTAYRLPDRDALEFKIMEKTT